MSDSSEQCQHACEALFRLAWLWCDDGDRALELVESAVQMIGQEQDIDLWMVRFYRGGYQLLQKVAPSDSSDLLVQKILKLSEPGRSALLFPCVQEFSPEAIEEILGLRHKQFLEAHETALQAVASDQESITEISSGLADTVWREMPSQDIWDRLQAIQRKAEQTIQRHPWYKQPVFLAITIGFLTILFLIGQSMMEKGDFSGSEEVIKLATSSGMETKEQFVPMELPVGELGDWFTMKGFPKFRVASGFEQLTVVGVRLFRQADAQIAIVAVPLKDRNAFFYIFEAEPFGVEIKSPSTWEILEVKNKVLAIEESEGVCFMIVMEGNRSDMERVLEASHKSR